MILQKKSVQVQFTYVDIVQRSNIVPGTFQKRLLDADASACNTRAKLVFGGDEHCDSVEAAVQDLHPVDSTKILLDGCKPSFKGVFVCNIGTGGSSYQNEKPRGGNMTLTCSI